jgi:hypothetical protein
MSSPAETVDRVFRWLGAVFRIVLPMLPLPGVYARLTVLFDLPVAAKLPDPTEPLPWTIPVAESWTAPIPGLAVSFDAIRIHVAAYEPPNPPPLGQPSHPVPASDFQPFNAGNSR